MEENNLNQERENLSDFGFSIQHQIYLFLKEFDKRSVWEESQKGSEADLVDKYDIKRIRNNQIAYYDVKSGTYSDKLTFTYYNSKGELSKCLISNKINLILKFYSDNRLFFIRPNKIKELILWCKENNQTFTSKFNAISKYIWITKEWTIANSYYIITM